jgi:hypothetical protein
VISSEGRARRTSAKTSSLGTTGRFPPPWSVEQQDACFVARDHNGLALAYVYFEEEPGRRSAENLMSHDEAGALALSIAKLPELLRKA